MTTTTLTPPQVTCPSWCTVGGQSHLEDYDEMGWIGHESGTLAIAQTMDDDRPRTVSVCYGTKITGEPSCVCVDIDSVLYGPAEARILLAGLQSALAMLDEVVA